MVQKYNTFILDDEILFVAAVNCKLVTVKGSGFVRFINSVAVGLYFSSTSYFRKKEEHSKTSSYETEQPPM